MPDWTWGESQSESGVVHESVANTDHDDAGNLKQGYSASSPLFSTDMLAYWPLHEDSGTTANDVHGTTDMTVNGPMQGVTGLLGTTAYSFDGTDDYCQTDSTNLGWFGGSDTWTISWWMLWDGSDTSKRPMLWYGDGSTTEWFKLGMDGSDYDFEFDDGSTKNVMKPAASGVDDGNWHHLAVTNDGSTITLYEDGSSLDTTNDVGSMEDTNNRLYLGRRAESEFYWNGDMAEVRSYGRALSTSELQQLVDVVETAGTWTGVKKTL